MASVLKMCKTTGMTLSLLLLGACATPQEPLLPALAPSVQSPEVPTPPPVQLKETVPPPTPPPQNVPSNAAPATVLTPPSARKPAPAHAPPIRPKWVLCDAWAEGTVWGKPQRLRNLPTWTYDLQTTNGLLQITAGRRTALWNGVNIELGFAPRLTNGQPALHSLDIAKTIEPLTLRPAVFQQSHRVVVIDPGHGGDNYGAKSAVGGGFEKEFALDWAFRLVPLLRQEGWTVHLTRTNDVEVPLAQRIAFADDTRADLFVSLHFNSTDQPQGHAEQGGLETYCLTPVGMPSTVTRHFDDELGHEFPNNSFDEENLQFATRIQRALVESTKRKDRGVRRARFMGVLRGQNRPAVLVEGGYLTDPVEAKLVGRPEYRQKLAEAVAKALSE
jgi:N-acetylmuramoyl-L-alanine amidase